MSTKYITDKEVFEKSFPYYLYLGMTYEQYWNGDSRLVVAYREADKLRIQAKNQELWLQGAYFYNALSVVMANCFGKNSHEKYVDKPFDILQDEMSEEEYAEKQRKEVIEKLTMFEKAFNKGVQKQ